MEGFTLEHYLTLKPYFMSFSLKITVLLNLYFQFLEKPNLFSLRAPSACLEHSPSVFWSSAHSFGFGINGISLGEPFLITSPKCGLFAVISDMY